ncbi:MAG: hypothetical protein AAFW73_12740 [Bacteroidota bacterium]
MLDKFRRLLNLRQGQLRRYLDQREGLRWTQVDGQEWIDWSPSVDLAEMDALLAVLWDQGYELTFYDEYYPSPSDPGAYFRYTTQKTNGPQHWSMTLGNHGWSGGIYWKKRADGRDAPLASR